MRLRWISSPRTCKGAYRAKGDEFDLDELTAASLLNQGLVVEVGVKPKVPPTLKSYTGEDMTKTVAAPPKDKKEEK